MLGIDDVRKAFQQVVADGLFKASWHEVTPDIVDSYIANYPGHRSRLEGYWEKLRDTINNVDPRMVARGHGDHLWGGWNTCTKGRLRRFLGGGKRRDIIDIFGDRKILPRRGHNTNFVLNYQDVPGRICAFQFLGEEADTLKMFHRSGKRTGGEGGLSMLDVLEPYEDTVYALGSPRTALLMQQYKMGTLPEPLKMVVYNQHTRKSWDSISARRVIFWEAAPSQELFAQVRQIGLGAGFVTHKPNLRKRSDQLHVYLCEQGLEGFMRIMQRFARPWPEALAKWIIDQNMDEGLLRGLASNLQFDHDERLAIIDAFPSRYRDQVEFCLGDERITLSTFVKGSGVVEADGVWSAMRGSRERELVSDAIIKILREITDEDTKKVYWDGFIRFKGEQIPFNEPVENIELNPRRWLIGAVEAAGLGRPNIQHSWSKSLMQLAQQFSTPQRMFGTSRLGIRSDGRVIFPNFTIEGGQAKEQRTVIRAQDCPAAHIHPPVKRRLRDCDEPCPERSLFTAMMTSFVSGLIAPLFGDEPRPVAVVGPIGSFGRSMAQTFCKHAGMRTIELEDGKWSVIDGAQQRVGLHNYPVMLDTRAPGLLKDWSHKRSKHLFMTTDVVEASALCTGANWVFIYGQKLTPLTRAIAPFDDVLWYLADLQRRRYELPHGQDREDAVLKDICLWYEGYLRKEDLSRYNETRKVMATAMSPSMAAMRLYCHLYRQKLVRRDYEPFMANVAAGGSIGKKSSSIVIDMEEERVFLSRASLRNAAKRAAVPAPDLVKISEDLMECGALFETGASLDGWVVSLKDWETLVADWQRWDL